MITTPRATGRFGVPGPARRGGEAREEARRGEEEGGGHQGRHTAQRGSGQGEEDTTGAGGATAPTLNSLGSLGRLRQPSRLFSSRDNFRAGANHLTPTFTTVTKSNLFASARCYAVHGQPEQGAEAAG